MSDEPKTPPADEKGDSAENWRQRAIDLAQTAIAGTMLFIGAFDTGGDKPLWLLGTVILSGLIVFEKDSKVQRLVESTLVLAIPLSYSLLGGVDVAYALTFIVLVWNGIDWAISLLNLVSGAKKAAIKLMKNVG